MKLKLGEEIIRHEEFKDLGIRLTLTNRRLIRQKRKPLFKTWKIEKQVKLEEIHLANRKPTDSAAGAISLILEMKNQNIINMGIISNNNQSPIEAKNSSDMTMEELNAHINKLAAHSAKVTKDNQRASEWVNAINDEARKFPIK